MHQQRRISPQQPALDRPTYRFKPSFSAFLSLIAAILTSTVFIVEIINPAKLSTTPVQNLPILITFVIFLIISVSFLTAYLALKLSGDITVAPIDINGRNLLSVPTYICWQDISSVKIRYFFGLRDILIRSAINKKRFIILDSFSYNFPKILDRVREYAGDNHPITIALAKEVSLPRQNPAKMSWRIIIGIVVILSIWLIGGNLYADYREQPLNQEIANYVRQHPKTPPNQAAIDLQATMAKLGISVERFGDGSKVKVNPDKAAINEWNKIEPTIRNYLVLDSEIAKGEDSFQPVPAKLHNYLSEHQNYLDIIRNRLINNELPEWGNDSGWIERNDPNAGDAWKSSNVKYFNLIVNIRKLLLVRILDRQKSSNPNNTKDLDAIFKLNQSLHNQRSIDAQSVIYINEEKINRLIRRLDSIPQQWEQTLINPDREKMMRLAIEHFSMSWNRTIRDPYLLVDEAKIDSIPNFAVSLITRYYHLAKPLTRLIAADSFQEFQKDSFYWSHQNVCRTNGKSGIYNYGANRYFIKIPIGNLDLELTKGVRQIKSQLKAGMPIDKVANEFKLASQTCQSEKWTAKVKDGEVFITLSHSPNWAALEMDEEENMDRYTYKINAKNIKSVL
jgi:hypothetical protein